MCMSRVSEPPGKSFLLLILAAITACKSVDAENDHMQQADC